MMLPARTIAGAHKNEAVTPRKTPRRVGISRDRLSERMIDMLPSALRRGLALLGLPLKWPHPTLRGNHLAAAGRLVKVPAFVLMSEFRIGPSCYSVKCGGATLRAERMMNTIVGVHRFILRAACLAPCRHAIAGQSHRFAPATTSQKPQCKVLSCSPPWSIRKLATDRAPGADSSGPIRAAHDYLACASKPDVIASTEATDRVATRRLAHH